MEVVYEMKGYIGNDYHFGDMPKWQGNIVIDDDNWVLGTASITHKKEIKEVLIFGNLLPNKIIDFMMVGPDIVVGCTFIKNGYCFEGVPVVGDFNNISAYPFETGMVTLDERIDDKNAYIDYIKNKVYKMIDIDDYKVYLDFYNSVYNNRETYKEGLKNMYNMTNGNVYKLARIIKEG